MNKFAPVIERYRTLQKQIPPSYVGKSDQIVIIDMGHGGMDKTNKVYATAPSKMAEHKDFTFFEGAWTRAIGYTWARELMHAGRSYSMISNDMDIPLTKRVQLAQFVYDQFPNRSMYLCSLHGNAFGIEKVSGVEVFTSEGTSKADPVATEYYNQLELLGWKMRHAYGDGDPDKEARFTMLTGPESFGLPAILPEIGFYTNYEQATEMCKPEVMDQIAELLLVADIQVDYLNLAR